MDPFRFAVAAMGLGLFAVQDAQGWWHRGPDVNQRVSGSAFIIDVDEATGDQRTLINLIARGKPGRAHFDSQAVFAAGAPDPDCPPELPFGAEILTQNWIETYADGSLLTGETSEGLVCTDGVLFIAEAVGPITPGSTGRFAGATGTWSAEVRTLEGGLSGTLRVDFD